MDTAHLVFYYLQGILVGACTSALVFAAALWIYLKWKGK